MAIQGISQGNSSGQEALLYALADIKTAGREKREAKALATAREIDATSESGGSSQLTTRLGIEVNDLNNFEKAMDGAIEAAKQADSKAAESVTAR